MTCRFGILAVLVLPAAAQTLSGVVDLHAHCSPDIVPRSIDALSLVRMAKDRGFRAIVLKNHYEPTAGLAWLTRRQTPGIEVFGGIALNRAVGGVNPAAVERMAKVDGGFGRVVWMPTFDAEHHVKTGGEKRPFVSVSRNSKLLPEVIEVLDIMGKNKLVLATGHSSGPESLLMIEEARRRGVEKIVVTHPTNSRVTMAPDLMQRAASLGAYLEFTANSIHGTIKEAEPAAMAAAIRKVGIERAILSSDFGQAGNPTHADGLEVVFSLLRREGLSVGDIERIVKTNPARLLGLE
jgi:hypothetical protein